MLACYGGEGNGVSAHKRATWAHRRVSVRRGGERRIGALACWGWGGRRRIPASVSGQKGGEGIVSAFGPVYIRGEGNGASAIRVLGEQRCIVLAC